MTSLTDSTKPASGRAVTLRAAVGVAVATVAISQYRSLYRVADRIGISTTFVEVALGVIGAALIWRYRDAPSKWPAPGGRFTYTRLTRSTTWVMSVGIMLPLAAVAAATTAALLGTVIPEQAAPVGTGAGQVARELVMTTVMPAIAEEAIFRIVLLGLLLQVMPPRRAVVVQAVVFAIAHTDLSLLATFSGPSATGYSLASTVGVAIHGLLYGFLVVELGRLWPAIVIHALHNLTVTSALVAPWLGAVVIYSIGAVAVVSVVRGVPGLLTGIEPATKRSLGFSTASQNRLVARLEPFVGQSPEIRRPLSWVSPRLVDRLLA